MPKAKALSLHIGVDSVDPKHYAGWKGELVSAEQDAVDMAAIAKGMGMKAKVLHTKAATRSGVLKAIEEAGKQLKAGDLFLLTFSGHGGQLMDVSGDELDLMDETWCLHDAQVIDDEVHWELGRFARGVRIHVIVDASPSGSVVRPHMPDPDPPPAGQRARLLPPLVREKVYHKNMQFYDELQKRTRADATTHNGPAVIVWLGCQDNQAAFEGKDNGVMTGQIIRLWNQGSFEGGYLRFFAHLVMRMPSVQTPQLRTYGDVAGFEMKKVFVP
jgi:metacaspase-1